MDIIENKECYVAFIDILGFKGYVKREDPDKVLNVFEKLEKDKYRITKDKRRFFENKELCEEYNLLADKTYMYIMSDSIVLAINSCYEGGLKFLAKWCMNIQSTLFFDYHLPARGGISKGIYYGNGKINFGRGMVSAVELESKAKYPRIIVDSTLSDEINEPSKFLSLEFDVHIAQDTDGPYYIDYLTGITWGESIKNSVFAFIKAGQECSDLNVKLKYDWLENKVKEKIDEYEENIYQDECFQQYLNGIENQ